MSVGHFGVRESQGMHVGRKAVSLDLLMLLESLWTVGQGGQVCKCLGFWLG